MKLNFIKIESISSSIALYFYVLFVLYLEAQKVKGWFSYYIPYMQKENLFGIAPLQIVIFINIAVILLLLGILFISNDCTKNITNWSKIAIAILSFKFVNYIVPLFNLTIVNDYKNLDIYYYDYIINALKIFVLFIFTPGFFFAGYRKIFSLNKTELFIFIIGLTSFLDIFVHAYNFYFVSFFVDLIAVVVIFSVLLPYSKLGAYLQEKYKIDQTTKLKLTIFLYFLGKGLINIEYNFEPMFGIIYLIIIAAILLSLSKWYIDNFSLRNSMIFKNIPLFMLIVIVIALTYRINNSFEQSEKFRVNYYNTVANLAIIQILDNENKLELPKNPEDEFKLTKNEAQQKLKYFNEHIILINNSFEDLISNPDEKLSTLFYDFYEDYDRAYIYLFDAYNDLIKYSMTKKLEYKFDYKIHIFDYKLLYKRITPELEEIYDSLKHEREKAALFKPLVTSLALDLTK